MGTPSYRISLYNSFQASDEYRALLSQYELLIQQLEISQKENRALKESAEKSRRESLAMTSQREASTVTIKYELESQKKEVLRLTQIIESLNGELEKTKKENSQVKLLIRFTLKCMNEYNMKYAETELSNVKHILKEPHSVFF